MRVDVLGLQITARSHLRQARPQLGGSIGGLFRHAFPLPGHGLARRLAQARVLGPVRIIQSAHLGADAVDTVSVPPTAEGPGNQHAPGTGDEFLCHAPAILAAALGVAVRRPLQHPIRLEALHHEAVLGQLIQHRLIGIHGFPGRVRHKAHTYLHIQNTCNRYILYIHSDHALRMG